MPYRRAISTSRCRNWAGATEIPTLALNRLDDDRRDLVIRP